MSDGVARLEGGRIALRPFTPADVPEMVGLRERNREHTVPWEPSRTERFYTATGQRAEVRRDVQERAADRAFAFAIEELDGGRLRGRISLANIVRGAWLNATLGYFVDIETTGRGFATEAVGLTVALAFGPLQLHRVQAAVMPHNAASRAVLERNGFRPEGHAPRYLHLDGAWRDHDLYAITVEEHPRPGG